MGYLTHRDLAWNERFSEDSITEAKTVIDELIDAAAAITAVGYLPSELELELHMMVRGDDGEGEEKHYGFSTKFNSYSESDVATLMKANIAPVLTEWEDLVTDSGKYSAVENVKGRISVSVLQVVWQYGACIDDTEIDSMCFSTVYGTLPDIVHMTGETYVVGHYAVISGSGKNLLRSVSIADGGAIGDAVIDTYNTDVAPAYIESHLVKVTDSLVALLYVNGSYAVQMDTVVVSAGGAFSARADRTAITASASHPARPLKVADNIIAIPYMYSTGAYGQYVCTWSIDDAGVHGDAALSTLQVSSSASGRPWLCHVRGDVYCLVYTNAATTDGYVATFTIDNDGAISSVIETLQFRDGSCYFPRCVHIHSGYVVVVWEDYASKDTYLTVIEIDSEGDITLGEEWKLDTIGCASYGEVFHLGGTFLAVSYAAAATGDRDGLFKTFEVDSEGSLNETIIDTFIWEETLSAGNSDLVHLGGGIYALAYNIGSSPTYEGWIKTLRIAPC